MLLGASKVVNYELPQNRYSFFESLEDKLLPQTRLEIIKSFGKELMIVVLFLQECS